MEPGPYPNRRDTGPFDVLYVCEGDGYELSNGHAYYCQPAGGQSSRANLAGAEALDTDPLAEEVGIDTGYAPAPGMLRAPDVAVGNVPSSPGWVKGVPLLAVEYADTGQDDAALNLKIEDLMRAGTKYVWVVRLVGPRRVEVYESGKPMRIATENDELTAPGSLANPVPVRALYDRDAAHDVALRNLLQRRGFASIEAVHEKGKAEGNAEGTATGKVGALLAVLDAREIVVDAEMLLRVTDCADPTQLDAWIVKAAIADRADQVFDPIASASGSAHPG